VEAVRDQVHKAADTLDKADTRAKMMQRALKNVEALPDTQAQALLPMADTNGDDSDT
jgi:DNA recombination protein RmuC